MRRYRARSGRSVGAGRALARHVAAGPGAAAIGHAQLGIIDRVLLRSRGAGGSRSGILSKYVEEIF